MDPDSDNPLLQPWTAPFGLPPFERVRPGHFAPAFGLRWPSKQIDRIARAPEAQAFRHARSTVADGC
jgi:peptidyl-dipeptidase Dcp